MQKCFDRNSFLSSLKVFDFRWEDFLNIQRTAVMEEASYVLRYSLSHTQNAGFILPLLGDHED